MGMEPFRRTREGEDTEDDKRCCDQEFKNILQSRRYRHVEQNDGNTYHHDHEGMSDTPRGSDECSPFEIALFMAGSLAYQVYRVIRTWKIPNGLLLALWVVIPALIFYYPHVDWIAESKFRWIFYALVFVCTPFVFQYTKNMKWDRWVGELSFPIYIGHHLIMMIVKKYFWVHTDDMKWFGICTVAGSVIFAVFLWKFVTDPIEKIRQKRVQTLTT